MTQMGVYMPNLAQSTMGNNCTCHRIGTRKISVSVNTFLHIFDTAQLFYIKKGIIWYPARAIWCPVEINRMRSPFNGPPSD